MRQSSHVIASADDEIIRLSHVTKKFGSATVLDSVSFSMMRGEVLGIIGPSGGGKSTLLKCLNLLEHFENGTISYEGELEIFVDDTGLLMLRDRKYERDRVLQDKDLIALRRDIGMVFQGFNLWGNRSVLQNLVLAPIVVAGESRKLAEARALALCEQFGLEDKISSPAALLSGGQQQRVAIVRALMLKPKVLLLDEVTSALDPMLTFNVMQAISQLRNEGLTLMLVTHHIEFASSVCDRLMYLDRGKILQIDTPHNLRNYPRDEKIKKFLEILEFTR